MRQLKRRRPCRLPALPAQETAEQSLQLLEQELQRKVKQVEELKAHGEGDVSIRDRGNSQSGAVG